MEFLAARAMLFYSLDNPNETNLFKLCILDVRNNFIFRTTQPSNIVILFLK